MLDSPLQRESLISSGSSFLGGRSKGRGKKALAATLMLTSLVDTFSVLVIYLLVNFSTAGEMLYLNKGMELPTAAQTEELQRNVVIKVEEDKLFIEEEEIKSRDLVKRLIEMKKNWEKYYPDTEFTGAMTIQADRRQAYGVLSRVVQAGGHAGYSDINFAVVRK